VVARVTAGLVAAALSVLAGGCGGSPSPPRHDESQPARAHRPTLPSLAPVARPVPRTVRVPVLTWHRVHRYATERQPSVPDLTVEPSTFESQIGELSRRGYHAVTNRQLYYALFKRRALPRKPVMLTFDDGYRDAVTDVLPVLRRFRMVGTFFIITGRVGGHEYVTARDVRSLDAAGMDLGAHSSTHRDMTTLTSAQLRRETTSSRRRLERMVGHPVPFFAYPFGRYDAQVVAAVRRARFSLAFSTASGTRLASTTPLTEPRLHVGRQLTARGLLALVEQGG
jgi:peptidoglycan/xylan/chitin deacetylase (PgdA/CDA1 family)